MGLKIKWSNLIIVTSNIVTVLLKSIDVFKPGACWLCAWFLEIAFMRTFMCVCVSTHITRIHAVSFTTNNIFTSGLKDKASFLTTEVVIIKLINLPEYGILESAE